MCWELRSGVGASNLLGEAAGIVIARRWDLAGNVAPWLGQLADELGGGSNASKSRWELPVLIFDGCYN